MAEEADPPAEGEEQPAEEMPPGNMFHVMIQSGRGLPEGTATAVSFEYSMLTDEQREEAEKVAAERGEGVKPVGILDGKTTEFEEPPAGTEHTYNFKQAYVLPSTTDLLLYRFITLPMQFTVEGLAVPGKAMVPLTDLVWRPDPKPEDPDEEDYLPGAPGSFLQGWYPIVPVEPLEEGQEFPEKAEIYVHLQISELLLPKEDLQLLNVLTISVKSLHNLPQLWGPTQETQGENHDYVYKLRYTIPGTEDGATIEIDVGPGEIIAKDPEPEPGEEGAEGMGEGADGAGGIEGAFEPEPGEDGEQAAQAEPQPSGAGEEEAKGKEAAVVEEEAYVQRTGGRVVLGEERKAARIRFDHTTAVAVQASAVARLKQLFGTRDKMKMELMRELRSGEAYVYSRKYHGQILIDCDALLEVGATSVEMRCAVEGAEDFAVPTEEELEATPPPGGEPETDPDGVPPGACPYVVSETYIRLGISVLRPLVVEVPKPPPVLPKVQDLLPTRAPMSQHKPAMPAAEEFSSELDAVITDLADEYHALFLAGGGAGVSLTGDKVAKRREAAILELNRTGRYYELKERLKKPTQRLVQERFYKQGLDPSSEDGKRVVSRLYLDLQDLINDKINEAFQAPRKEDPTRQSEEALALYLKDKERLAHEAELILDYPLACSHLNARIISSPADAVLWYDYGALCVRSGNVSCNMSKAEECLREALMLDPRHTDALLTYGVLLCSLNRYADAETYLVGAASFSPDSVLAWSMLVLFYDMQSRDADRRRAVRKCLDLDAAAAAAAAAEPPRRRSPYLRAATLCSDLLAIKMVERAEMREKEKHGDSRELQLVLARAYIKVQQYAKARKILGPNGKSSPGVLDKDKRCGEAMVLLGHTLYMDLGWHKLRSDAREEPQNAQVLKWYEKALVAREPHSELVQYMRMGRLYLWAGQFYEAKDVLIKACRIGPSASTWLGLAIACYQRSELDQSEQALCEANILDPHNAQVWGMLCVVCLAAGDRRAADAAMALDKALHFGLTASETWPVGYGQLILEQIATLYAREGNYASAIAALTRGLESSFSPSLNCKLGEVYLASDELALAATAFDKVVNPTDSRVASEEERRTVLVKLVHVSKRLGRSREIVEYENQLKLLGAR